jgi:hypothetical protein
VNWGAALDFFKQSCTNEFAFNMGIIGGGLAFDGDGGGWAGDRTLVVMMEFRRP